jgi:cyanophycin synthetase
MNIVDSILFHVRNRPDETAIIFPQGRISWQQLDRALCATARLFHKYGLVAEDRVGVTMKHPILHLISTLALAGMGVAHVVLPVSDPSGVRRGVMEKLRLKAIVIDSDTFALKDVHSILLDRLPKSREDMESFSDIVSDSDARTWLFLQSSGTTGEPKFAELTHAVAMERSERFLPLFDCGTKDVFWPISRLDFVVAKQRAIYALQAGAALCLPIGLAIGQEMLSFLRSAGVTLACGTPSHLYQLTSLCEKADAIPTLRAFEVRSATISERLRKAFKNRFSGNLFVVYGTNEGEALAIASPELQERVPNTVGKATESIELEVVDEHGKPVAIGVVGEVRVRGPGVIAEYFEIIEASNKAFRDGWFYPGDMASLSKDKALVLQGRKDDMMIFDGMNIYPAEIETALMDHPLVKDVAAYPIKHEQLQDVPAAAVIVQAPVSEEELIRYCIARIGVKHPRKIRILKEFPRNSMGKVLKRELASLGAT